jgi:hypothetical protein
MIELIRKHYRGTGKRVVGYKMLEGSVFVYTLSELKSFYGYYAPKDRDSEEYHFGCGFSCAGEALEALRYVRKIERFNK